jgi:molybdenum cofactor biosynthesis enzyme MoaA
MQKELSFEEIKDIVLQARRLGCTKWNISGGEPMLRSDFAEIFDFIRIPSSLLGVFIKK